MIGLQGRDINQILMRVTALETRGIAHVTAETGIDNARGSHDPSPHQETCAKRMRMRSEYWDILDPTDDKACDEAGPHSDRDRDRDSCLLLAKKMRMRSELCDFVDPCFEGESVHEEADGGGGDHSSAKRHSRNTKDSDSEYVIEEEDSIDHHGMQMEAVGGGEHQLCSPAKSSTASSSTSAQDSRNKDGQRSCSKDAVAIKTDSAVAAKTDSAVATKTDSAVAVHLLPETAVPNQATQNVLVINLLQ
jgi:hypothetical protein